MNKALNIEFEEKQQILLIKRLSKLELFNKKFFLIVGCINRSSLRTDKENVLVFSLILKMRRVQFVCKD